MVISEVDLASIVAFIAERVTGIFASFKDIAITENFNLFELLLAIFMIQVIIWFYEVYTGHEEPDEEEEDEFYARPASSAESEEDIGDW